MAEKFFYVNSNHQGGEINNAVVNVFDTLALATAKATALAYDADQSGQQIVVLENPITKNGNTFYRQYEWDGTAYRIINDTVGSDEIILTVDFPPIETFVGGDDTGIVAGITPTLPQGVKLITSTDANDVIHEYEVTDAGLGTQSIKEIHPPLYIYENTKVEVVGDIAGSVLGLRPNTIYQNTASGVVIQTDAAGTPLVIEDGIFDFEFETDVITLAVGVTTIDINSAQVVLKVPADLGNVEAFSAGLLSKAVEGSDSNNSDAKSTGSVNILPNTASTFDVEVSVAGSYKFSAHLNVKKQ